MRKISSYVVAACMLISSVLLVNTDTIKAAKSTSPIEIVAEPVIEGTVSENGLVNIKPSRVFEGVKKTGLSKESPLPAAYMNSRKQALEKFPATRSQNPFGTCWAFSSIAMAEFNMIQQGLADKTVDYSELHLAYYCYHNQIDPLGGTKGDSVGFNSSQGYLNCGGNRTVSSRIMSAWKGVVDESQVPYSTAVESGNDNYPLKSDAFAYDKAIMTDAYIINVSPKKGSLDEAKRAIMKYGSIGIDYSAFLGRTKQIEYNGERITSSYSDTYWPTDHGVTVVGWDDNFPKSKFAVEPPKNGAWLVRNSWTDDPENTTEASYFWMSYYESTIAEDAWAFKMAKADKYDRNYQYDGAYFVGAINGPDAVSNIFTAQKNEKIKAVKVSATYVKNDKFVIRIYKNLKNKADPRSGTLISIETAEVSRGIHDIELKKPVSVKKGTTFAVVVETESGFYDMEYARNNYDIWDTKATRSGNCYYIFEDKWNTLDEYNNAVGDAAVKVLTVDGTGEESPAIDESKNCIHIYCNPELYWKLDKCKAVYNCCMCGKVETVQCKVKKIGIKTKPTYFEKGDTIYEADFTIGHYRYIGRNEVSDIPALKLPATSFTKLKKVNKKSVSAKWKKVGVATGYEIKYSTFSNLKYAKTLKIKGAKKLSTTIKNLRLKKKYYFKIRTYKTGIVDDEKMTVYSSWSKVKSIKLK